MTRSRTARRPRPLACSCALAIGGLDPGGGAGIVADLRAFAAAGAFGAAVVAVLTVQSTRGLISATAVAASAITAAAREVLLHQDVRAMKLGALGSAANVRAVARLLAAHPDVPAVIDTPMLPSRGEARLLAARALLAVREALVPRATILTVNADEAAALLDGDVVTLEDARAAAAKLCAMGARATLVKGGHLALGRDAIDVLCVKRGARVVLHELRARRLDAGDVHGTGCTLASLIAGRLAVRSEVRAAPDDEALVAAVRWAKRLHHASLARAVTVGEGAKVLVFDE